MAEKAKTYLRVRNWSKYQHYGKRRPPWIKLHCDTLEGETWVEADDAQRLLAIVCMLLASKTGNCIPRNPKYVQRVGFLEQLPDFDPLIKSGFLEETSSDQPEEPPGASVALADASNALAGASNRLQDATSETEAKPKSNKNEVLASAQEVLAHLNQVTGRSFKRTLDIEACIKREKASVQDCKAVIDHKWQEWGNNPDMAKNVNPTTPFRSSHFQAYLDEAQAGPVSQAQGEGQPVPRRSINEALREAGGV